MNDPRSNLTKSQWMIWTGQQMNPDQPLYNVPFTFEIFGELDEEVFAKAHQELVTKTDTLRTVFTETDGLPNQIIQDTTSVNLQRLDFSGSENPRGEYENWITVDKNRPFDLSQSVFRSALIKISDDHFSWYINQHHIITDAWGNAVLFQKLGEIYDKLRSGQSSADVEILPFSSFREVEQKSRVLTDAKNDFWEKKTDKVQLVKILDQDASFKTENEKVRLAFGSERSERIRAMSQRDPFRSLNQDFSSYLIFCTAIVAYLSKISGQREISVGTPTHNRFTKNQKESPGLFIEFFPLNFTVKDSDTFESLFGQVRDEVSHFLKNVRPSLSSEDSNRKFNVVFNYSNATSGKFAGMDVKSTYIHTGHNDPRHELFFHVNDFDSTGVYNVEIDISMAEDEDLFSQFIPEQFLHIFDQLTTETSKNLDVTSLVGESEAEFLINGLNQTQTEFDYDLTLIHRFQQQAAESPNATALRFEGMDLTYEKLDRFSNQLAHKLIDKGIVPGDVVAIALERSFEMMISIIGIQKAGAAYLPIEPDFPEKRIEFMLTNSGAKVLISEGELVQNLSIGRMTKEDLMSLSTSTETVNLAAPDNLAYVMYTSGSTGQPKGVMVTHRSVLNRVLWGQGHYGAKKEDVVMQKTPYTFDVSIWEMFWPLLVGGKLVIAKPHGHKDPGYLVNMVRSEKVSVIHFVPSMLTQFLLESEVSECKTLEQVFCSGEALLKRIQDQCHQKLDTKLHNLYGPTEAGIEVTHWTCSPDDPYGEVPIGKPTANTQCYILNENLEPVAYGQKGDLFLGGVQLAQGYINNQELTDEKFRPSPFIQGERIYDSGDIAQFKNGGTIFYKGRKDDQVKISGLRIELGEIETSLSKHEAVHEASAVYAELQNSGKRLVAAYTSSQDISEQQLRTFLKAYLPEFMIPHFFVRIEEMPVNTNGKVDKNQVIELIRQNDFMTASHVELNETLSATEEELLRIWKEALEVENLGIHDNFLASGGHSLTAIKIVSRVKKNLGLRVQINLVFEKPTVASMAAFIDKQLVS